MTAGDIKLHGYVTDRARSCNRESACQPVLVIAAPSGDISSALITSEPEQSTEMSELVTLRGSVTSPTAELQRPEPEPVVGVTDRGQR